MLANDRRSVVLGVSMRCESVSKSGYICGKETGHIGAHRAPNRNIYWTDDDIIWDYLVDDFRAII